MLSTSSSAAVEQPLSPGGSHKGGWWTEERVAALKQKWADGISASNIGMELSCTRNSVIGKVHRLQLQPRKTLTARTPGAPPRRSRPRLAFLNPMSIKQPKIPIDLLPPKPSTAPVGPGVDLIGLEHFHCRFIIGSSADGLALYCGAPKAFKAYCVHHAYECYNMEYFRR